MICHDSLKIAEEMGIDRRYALLCRRRFLTQRLWDLEAEIDEVVCDTFRCQFEDQCDCRCRPMCRLGLSVFLYAGKKTERDGVQRELRVCERLLLPSSGSITDEMVERAREFSVCDLIPEFPRGRAVAWCHDDHNPSLYYGSRKQVAICPVCNKTFDAIDILMGRDGLSFTEAVRQLQ